MQSMVRLLGAMVLAFSLFASSGVSVFAGGSGYKLPYPAGVTYKVSQAPNPAHVAVDFGMSENSTIVAARSGKVVQVVTKYTACGGSDFKDKNNYITIAHEPDDKKYDVYVHINSASVKVGDVVAQGQTIAKSGKVGYTRTGSDCAPHLHFQVQKTLTDQSNNNRIQVSFDDVTGGSLSTGTYYTSGNNGSSASIPQPQPSTLTRSNLYVDPGNHYLKLEFCGTNIHQTMAVKSWRSGRNFGTQWIRADFGATEGCTTVTNLADGAVLRTQTTYNSAVAFTEGDAGAVCHSARGLCDAITSKGW